MNSNHNVKDLDLLYADAKSLINVIVKEKIDEGSLKKISNIIIDLEESWHGQDAIIQINKLIDVKNLLIDNRDIIGNIGVYISMLAKNYRDAQNLNTMILPVFTQLNYAKIIKSSKLNSTSPEIYMNNNVLNVITNLKDFKNNLKDLNISVEKIMHSIFGNWIQEDENKNYALKMFDVFFKNIETIIESVDMVSKCISTSIENYNISLNNISNMPSLESMFDKSDINVEKNYTIEEQKVLKSIKRNFYNNKELTDNFNNTLIEEVRNELISKGIMK